MTPAEAHPEIRAPRESDLDGMLHVLDQAFDGWPGLELDVPRRDHLDWKCHSSPQAMQHHAVAVLEGGVAGMSIRIDRPIRFLDRDYPGELVVDDAVLPEAQGRGIFSAITAHLAETAAARGIPMNVDFGFDQRLTGLGARLGRFQAANRLSLLFKPLSPMDVARRTSRLRWVPRPLVAGGISVLQAASRLRHGPSRPAPGTSTIRTVHTFDSAADRLYEQASRDFQLISARDAAFLNWRYCDPRGGAFTVRAEFDGDDLNGYIALKLSGGRAHVVDILTLPNRPDVVSRLAWHAEAISREFGADGIACQLPESHPYPKPLHQAGFLATRSTTDINVVPRAASAGDLEFLRSRDARIHFTQGDSDLV